MFVAPNPNLLDGFPRQAPSKYNVGKVLEYVSKLLWFFVRLFLLLLKLINKTIVDKKCDPRDKIDALDWDNSINIEREWVKFVLPDLKKHFIDCIKHLHLENVFIRNIMHELKTPITKGKIIVELPNSEENDEKLKKELEVAVSKLQKALS